ncbi:MAG: DedA family protein [Dehalococcoidia bacterium]|nr:DedA family protein [Dehalococcoidia bacterium]
MFDALTEWVIDVVESLGYVGVALLVMVENLFPPIPSEIVLALAGFVASRGDGHLVGMILAATIGSVVGALVLYWIAAWFGAERVRWIVRRYGWLLRLTEHDLDRAEAWFDRWSNVAVLLCRCVPLVRSVISIPAGLRRMPLAPFTLYTTVGSLVWNAIFVIAGYQLGERWEDVEPYADYFQLVVLIAIPAAVMVFLARRFLGGRSSARPAEASTGTDDRRDESR